jgi:choline dehydrogenase-like flavoprotein
LPPEPSDVIVVGSGPGGATVARDLSRRGKKVLILEWGPGGPIRGTFAQYLSELLIPGKSLLVTGQLLGMVRGITTGGSSVFYYATCFPAPLEMFASYGVAIADEVRRCARIPSARSRRDDDPDGHPAGRAPGPRRSGEADKFMYQDRWKPGMRSGTTVTPPGQWSARMYVEEAVARAVLLNGARVTR